MIIILQNRIEHKKISCLSLQIHRFHTVPSEKYFPTHLPQPSLAPFPKLYLYLLFLPSPSPLLLLFLYFFLQFSFNFFFLLSLTFTFTEQPYPVQLPIRKPCKVDTPYLKGISASISSEISIGSPLCPAAEPSFLSQNWIFSTITSTVGILTPSFS